MLFDKLEDEFYIELGLNDRDETDWVNFALDVYSQSEWIRKSEVLVLGPTQQKPRDNADENGEDKISKAESTHYLIDYRG